MSEATQPCPNCAAPITVDARWTRMAVCGTCQSAVTFDDGTAGLAGKLSVLPPSRTALFVGATGEISRRPFEVLGRVRYGWERGYWDEWHLLWTDDGTTGWLSEDEERLSVESLLADASAPVAAGAEPGSVAVIEGQDFVVAERGVGLLEGGEGSLPFTVRAGEATPFVEMRSADGLKVASVEFGIDGTRVFLGASVDPSDLNMQWTRQELGIQGDLPVATAADGSVPRIQSLSGGVRPLKCNSCGGGLEVGAGEGGVLPAAVSCAYCGAANNLSGKALTCPNCTQPVQTKAGDAKVAQCIACGHQIDVGSDNPASLGAAGEASGSRFKPGDKWSRKGINYTVTGMLRFDGYSDGEAWNYWEYCLFEKSVGYRWLVHSDGKWTFATRVFDHPPMNRDFTPTQIEFRGSNYTVTEDNRVKIGYVAGELPWVARKGDTCRVLDTAAKGGQSLSVEWGPDEVECYLGTRVTVKSGGVKDLKNFKGILPTHGRWLRQVLLMMLFTLVAGFGAVYWAQNSSQPKVVASGVLKGETIFGAGSSFELTSEDTPLHFGFSNPIGSGRTSLKGAWAHYTCDVVDSTGTSAKKFTMTHTDFYKNGNGSLTYDTRTDVLVDVPPGTYTVKVSGQRGLVDGSRTTPIEPSLQFNVEVGSWQSKSDFGVALGLLFVVFGCLCFYGLMMLSSQRAETPKLPMATIVWTLLVWGGLGWAWVQPEHSRSGPPPRVAAAPTYKTVAAYSTLRAAALAASVRYNSGRSGSSSYSGSRRSYSGGGYSGGK